MPSGIPAVQIFGSRFVGRTSDLGKYGVGRRDSLAGVLGLDANNWSRMSVMSMSKHSSHDIQEPRLCLVVCVVFSSPSPSMSPVKPAKNLSPSFAVVDQEKGS